MENQSEHMYESGNCTLFYVTGTAHGSHIYTDTEGSARRIFHKFWKGESIIDLRDAEGKIYQEVHRGNSYLRLLEPGF